MARRLARLTSDAGSTVTTWTTTYEYLCGMTAYACKGCIDAAAKKNRALTRALFLAAVLILTLAGGGHLLRLLQSTDALVIVIALGVASLIASGLFWGLSDGVKDTCLEKAASSAMQREHPELYSEVDGNLSLPYRIDIIPRERWELMAKGQRRS